MLPGTAWMEGVERDRSAVGWRAWCGLPEASRLAGRPRGPAPLPRHPTPAGPRHAPSIPRRTPARLVRGLGAGAIVGCAWSSGRPTSGTWRGGRSACRSVRAGAPRRAAIDVPSPLDDPPRRGSMAGRRSTRISAPTAAWPCRPRPRAERSGRPTSRGDRDRRARRAATGPHASAGDRDAGSHARHIRSSRSSDEVSGEHRRNAEAGGR